MIKTKYLILGAGPAGLTFANKLLNNGEDNFIVLERNDEPGGLCRSVDMDNAPLDIGGGHFLDVKREKVLDFLFYFMPKEEWNKFERNSKIVVKGNVINSPFEANIWQMTIEDQVDYLKSIAVAGCNLNQPMPEKFIEWIYWKLGNKIAEDYMIPYNTKMFGDNLNCLGTYWLNKLPNVSFEETLLSCLERKAYGTQPGHAEFFYPKKYGYGELWKRMANNLKEKIKYEEKVTKIDCQSNIVNDSYQADYIINTIPWLEYEEIMGVDNSILSKIKKLNYSSVVIEYNDDNLETDAQWIYYPNLQLDYHRILVRKSFYPNSNGYWTETNINRYKPSNNKYHYVNDYAYPLNTIGKQEIMNDILNEFKKHNVYGLGRWGEWQHYNSDVVVELAMNLADKLCNK